MLQRILLILACVVVAGSASAAKPAKNPRVVVTTSMGTFECELFANDAPKTVKNFVGLSKRKFFNGLRFHRVVKGFVIQGGDPNSRDVAKMSQWGMGGESIYGKEFEDELDESTPSYKTGYVPGVLAMANHGPNTNSSQFFVMCGGSLPHKYTIFGRVTKGMDVVSKINLVEVVPGDRPKKDVMIKSITVK